MSGENKVIARMIIEVMGKPKEHLVETLEDFAKKISEEKGVKLEEKKIHEPSLVKDQKDLYSTFAEIEVEVETPLFLALLMFKYMPAHIEVISPENFILDNNGFSDILNEITRRLHGYDELARVFQLEKSMMEKKIQELEGKK